MGRGWMHCTKDEVFEGLREVSLGASGPKTHGTVEVCGPVRRCVSTLRRGKQQRLRRLVLRDGRHRPFVCKDRDVRGSNHSHDCRRHPACCLFQKGRNACNAVRDYWRRPHNFKRLDVFEGHVSLARDGKIHWNDSVITAGQLSFNLKISRKMEPE